MLRSYRVSRLFDGHQWHQDCTISLSGDKVVALGLDNSSGAEKLDGMLVPGFVDIQVNGGGGQLFNESPDLHCLAAMVAAHARFGTTAMLPTLITDDLAKMAAAAAAVSQALAQKLPGVLGIHFEGPHLSEPRKGIHKREHIRRLGQAEMALYCREDLGVRLLTVAPETVHPEDIRQLVQAGVKVCLGHSDADFDTVQAALAAGADGFTHLFNAMSQLGSRSPGMVGAALAGDARCGIILDGYHLHPACARLAFKAKGVEGLMLVTDAMAAVGSSERHYPYFGDVLYRDGDRMTDKDGRLAGSALDMATAVRNAMAQMGASLEQALQMAGLTPARYLGLDGGGLLQPGMKADMVLLSNDLEVKQSWIGGQMA
ncbi:N-acetylglucosamine-6-phosphate deacetylase [Gallaecimonas kandeliae]|uniref:N-acetylglucosamine-6-phosphate deacetylase n=1 Tax=Gallaecimonas kandeliae TaxID=3029055 RepID=UPI00264950BD|nr:N-acetylglucosamine-6-phosphate deacetylase [Gallaecimonas kandeliae]WKE66153.1 N-acetylglucosamine-6-phosphate deacetylase [Gallaecimonas kandeliae]